MGISGMNIPPRWLNGFRSALNRNRRTPPPCRFHSRNLPPPEVGPGGRNSRGEGLFQGLQPGLALEIPVEIGSLQISCTKVRTDFDVVIGSGALPPRLGGKPEAPATSITKNEDN